jgi:hypothetical protein
METDKILETTVHDLLDIRLTCSFAKVVDVRAWSETSISGGGGGGGSITTIGGNTSGYIKKVAPITSTVTVVQQAFIQFPDGHEFVLKVTDTDDFPLRVGHTLAYITYRDDDDLKIYSVYNPATKKFLRSVSDSGGLIRRSCQERFIDIEDISMLVESALGSSDPEQSTARVNRLKAGILARSELKAKQFATQDEANRILFGRIFTATLIGLGIFIVYMIFIYLRK